MNINIEIPISLGELLDKITILEIKTEKISNATKKLLAQKELNLLEMRLLSLGLQGVQVFRDQLKYVNSKLWDIEDEIRLKEHEQNFDAEFIALAREVYLTNDQRFKIKNEINTQFSSNIREVKSYQDYSYEKAA